MNRRHSIALAAASGGVATLLVGGIAWAAIPGDGGVINGCYGKIGGVVRVIDVAKGEKCLTALEVPLSWNQKGSKGDPGLPGATGTPGTNGSNGNDGVSPTVHQLAAGDPNCPAGGAAITDAHGSTAYACSGQNGQPFSGTFTSPSGEYSISVTDAGISLARGGAPIVQITGSSIQITGDSVAVASALDTNIVTGRDTIISAGQNAAITTGRDASVSTSRNLTVQSGLQTTMRSGGATSVQSDGQITIQSAGATSVQSSATLSLNGSRVQVNGAVTCTPAARIGDTVAGGQIATGSTTVCIG